MADKKQTMYEILRVSPFASLSEIKTAHKLLTESLAAEKSGLKREEIDLKLQMLNLALNTLSNQADRDAYDARLAARKFSAHTSLRPSTSLVSQSNDAKALMIAAAIEATHSRGASSDKGPSLLTVMAATADKSASSLWKILRIVAGLLVLGIVIKVASVIVGGRQPSLPGGTISKAEEKVIIQEYYQQHGVRPGSKEEVDLLELENRRKANEERAAALLQEKQDQEYRRFVEESRRTGEEVSNNLRREEERMRAERKRVQENRRRLGLE